jgi:hypothetical protein
VRLRPVDLEGVPRSCPHYAAWVHWSFFPNASSTEEFGGKSDPPPMPPPTFQMPSTHPPPLVPSLIPPAAFNARVCVRIVCRSHRGRAATAADGSCQYSEAALLRHSASQRAKLPIRRIRASYGNCLGSPHGNVISIGSPDTRTDDRRCNISSGSCGACDIFWSLRIDLHVA